MVNYVWLVVDIDVNGLVVRGPKDKAGGRTPTRVVPQGLTLCCDEIVTVFAPRVGSWVPRPL